MRRESDRRTALAYSTRPCTDWSALAPIPRPRRPPPSRFAIWCVLAFLGGFWGAVIWWWFR